MPAPTTAAPAHAPEPTAADQERAAFLVDAYRRLTAELSRVIVGQSAVVEQLAIAMLARGHCLLEGVPGLAKTLIIRSLADTMELSFRRIQFTPDLMPSDITGTDVIEEDHTTGRREMVFKPGPIFAQMVLADEINRTPPKTQASLLEAMQEHSVTVGGKTYVLKEPFFVLATQNPIEQEGTYPLPEAQRDRFLFLVKVAYPTYEEEWKIIEQTTSSGSVKLAPVMTGEQLLECQETVRRVPVPAHVLRFVLDIVRKSRPTEPDCLPFVKQLVDWGPGPRACQQLVLAGKVRALLQGRYHVTLDDIATLAHPVLRHRIVPSFAAEARGVTVDGIIDQILEATPRRSDMQVV